MTAITQKYIYFHKLDILKTPLLFHFYSFGKYLIAIKASESQIFPVEHLIFKNIAYFQVFDQLKKHTIEYTIPKETSELAVA